jgi:hypothetical protein
MLTQIPRTPLLRDSYDENAEAEGMRASAVTSMDKAY